MAEILKGEWTDENGNVYYLHTSADLVFCADGKTVEQKMKKLDGIAENANNYTHPTTPGNKHIPSGGASGQILRWSADGTAAWGADKDTVYTHPSTHPASMITQDASHRFVSDTEKSTWNGKASTAEATQSQKGLMSAADKKKLDGVETGANKYVHPTSSGNKHIPSGGKSGQILRWSADGTAAWGEDKDTVYIHPTNHPASMITPDANHRFVSDTEKSTWNGKIGADTGITFSEASDRGNLASGEKLGTLFGKVKKWFSDLKPFAFLDLIQNATTAAADRAVSAAVAKALQDQINTLNTKIDNTVVTIDQMWCVAHFVRGAGLWLDINTNRAVSIEGVDVYDNTSKWMHSYIESQSNVFGNRHFILNTNGMSLTEGYSYLVKISGKMS